MPDYHPSRLQPATDSFMLLIAIDTSGRNGSVALCRGDAENFIPLQLAMLDGGNYSERLLATLASMLRDNNLDKNDIDAFVVVSGPGSFTGLRVGLATVKGLCEALGKPLATVSMLEAIALHHGKPGEVTAILNAGRGEIYVGEYRVAENAELLRGYIAKLAEFRSEAKALLTPDESVANALRAADQNVVLVEPVRADGIGRIGLRKLLQGDIADPATVDVNYMRRSDAELFHKPTP
jgi:tRNA threonylcarbamoyladenosine biosynthesis protein TsaB